MKTKRILLSLAILTSLLGVGCIKPVQKPVLKEVKSHETAFVIPLEGSNETSQGQLMSAEYLEKKKVATKRITIPTKWLKTGRFSHQGEWIPTVKVITVDRTPQSYEWTDTDGNDKNALNDGWVVESRDSIGFRIGGVVQIRVTESDASKFLYSYSGKSLTLITTEDARRFMGNVLTREFGKRDIEECKKEKGDVFKMVYSETKEHFANFGIDVTHIGQSGEIYYLNQDIQKSIDDKAKAEMAVQIASKTQEREEIENETKKQNALIERQKEVELEALESDKQKVILDRQIMVAKLAAEEQTIINEKNKEIADTDMYVAEQKQKVMETLTVLKELEIRQTIADSELERSKNYQGGVPNSVTIFGGEQGPVPFVNMKDIMGSK